MRRRGDSDQKRAQKLARRHARCVIVQSCVDINRVQHCMHAQHGGRTACPICDAKPCPSPTLSLWGPCCRAQAALQEAEAEGEQPRQQSNGHALAGSSREALHSNGKSHRSYGQVLLALARILRSLTKASDFLAHQPA